MELANRRILVLGGGKSGLAAVRLLLHEGARAILADRAPSETLRAELARLGVPLATAETLPQEPFDRCIASPGFSLEHPWIRDCNRRRIPISSEIDLAASRFHGTAVAITGSKGKSSVVKLIADTLTAAGRPAVPCGNYGTPFAQVALDTPQAIAIVEISSFQMEHTNRFAPDAAAILNIQPEHLDRHHTLQAYAALKEKLLALAKPGALTLRPHDLGSPPFDADGTYFGNPILAPALDAAVRILRHLRLPDPAIARGIRTFQPLPHRYQLIVEVDQIRFIDDSKATNLAALLAAVQMTQGPIRLIAGGLPKENDFTPAQFLLSKRAKKVYLIGSSAQTMANAWQSAVPCLIAETLDRAVAQAWADANPGDTILLSPGTASFDQFNSYGERGERFARQVREVTASPRQAKEY